MIIKTDEIFEKAASLVEISIKKLLKKQKYVVLGVPGGRSVEFIFKILKKKNIPWNKVHFFMVDERRVPISSKESNFRILKRNLISSVKPPQGNVHPFNYKKPILSYTKELKKYGGRFDIILLSSGEDGHVGGLFPFYTIEDESDNFIIFDKSPKPPLKRMTASRKLLEKSKIAILLFSGEEKELAFKMFNDEKISINGCPAKLVNKIKENYVITKLKK